MSLSVSDFPKFSIVGHRPLLLVPGDIVLVQHFVVEDAGDQLSVALEFGCPRFTQRGWVDRRCVKMLLRDGVPHG